MAVGTADPYGRPGVGGRLPDAARPSFPGRTRRLPRRLPGAAWRAATGAVIIGGASAGGNLAAALILRARDEGLPLPAAVVLMTPGADLTEAGDSHQTNLGLDPLIPGSSRQAFLLYAAGEDLSHPYLSPLNGDFTKGFPPAILTTGTRDMLLSDTVLLHRALRRAGVRPSCTSPRRPGTAGSWAWRRKTRRSCAKSAASRTRTGARSRHDQRAAASRARGANHRRAGCAAGPRAAWPCSAAFRSRSRRPAAAVRGPAAGDAVGRGAGCVRVRLAAPAVERPRRPLPAPADDDWLTLNVWTPAADPAARRPVHGVDLRRRLQGGLGRRPRLRRRPPRPRGRRGAGHLQLPHRGGGLRPDRRCARQPGPARPGGRARMGPRQHRRLRRRPGPGHRLRPVGRGRVGRLAAGRCRGPRACSGGRSRRACPASSTRRRWRPTSPRPSRPSSACGRPSPTCPGWTRSGWSPPGTRWTPSSASTRTGGARSR